jgi:hypothetical protein
MTARPVRNLIAAVMCLALTAMGLAAAMARGQTQIGGQVAVLCSGGGLVQITLDAKGEPTGGTHLCPDLAVSLLAAVDLAPPQVTAPDAPYATFLPQPARVSASRVPQALRARGPPVSA